MRLLFLDLETTGLDHEKSGILQIYAEYHENGKCVKNINVKCAASEEVVVSLGALAVNKTAMTDIRDVYKEGTNSEYDALEQFCDFLLNVPVDRNNPLTIAGHNVAFDVGFLKSRLKKVLNVDRMEDLVSYRVIDTSTIGEFLRQAGLINLKKMSLGLLGEALGLDFNNDSLHDAETDVKLTAAAYYKMLELVRQSNG